jgi:hypothetical protein
LREDTCANCGATIYLVKVGHMTYRWVADPEKPDAWRCNKDPSYPAKDERHHAPVSARDSHR